MMKGLLAAWSGIFLFLINSPVFAKCDIVDDLGAAVRLQQPASRIVSLAPDLTELLFAMGAGSSVVGVMAGSDYPAEAAHLPVVANYRKLNLEKIMSLHPDLIVMWGDSFISQREKLQQAGIPIYRNDPHRLEDIPRSLRALGCLTGHHDESEQLSKQFLERLNTLKRKYQQRKPVKVFFQINAHPLMTINHRSWIDQAVQLCGGVNIYHDAALTAPQVSWETILVRNPEVVIMDANRAVWRADWQAWPGIAAVQHHAIYTLDSNLIERASMRLLQGVETLCGQIEMARQKGAILTQSGSNG